MAWTPWFQHTRWMPHSLSQLAHQLADASDEAVDILVKALRQPDKTRQALAIRVLHLIGPPKNEPGIPELIYHIGDPNLPGWSEAVETLTDMGPDVAVPHLIQALWKKDRHITWMPGRTRRGPTMSKDSVRC